MAVVECLNYCQDGAKMGHFLLSNCDKLSIKSLTSLSFWLQRATCLVQTFLVTEFTWLVSTAIPKPFVNKWNRQWHRRAGRALFSSHTAWIVSEDSFQGWRTNRHFGGWGFHRETKALPLNLSVVILQNVSSVEITNKLPLYWGNTKFALPKGIRNNLMRHGPDNMSENFSQTLQPPPPSGLLVINISLPTAKHKHVCLFKQLSN